MIDFRSKTTMFVPPEKPAGDVPDFFYHLDDPNSEKKLLDYLYSINYWKLWDGKESTQEYVSKAAIKMAEYRRDALLSAKKLSGTSDRAFVLGLYEAQKSGWYHLLPEEYSTIEELIRQELIDAENDNANGSTVYDLRFIVEVLLPTLEKNNIPASAIVGLPGNMSKARAAVPTLRRAIDEHQKVLGAFQTAKTDLANAEKEAEFVESVGDVLTNEEIAQAKDNHNKALTAYAHYESAVKKSQESLEESLKSVMTKVSDGTKSVRAFREELAQESGRKKPPLPPIDGSCYLLPNGQEAVVFVGNQMYTRSLEILTKSVVEKISMRDPLQLLEFVRSNVIQKPFGTKRYQYDVYNRRFIESTSGFFIFPDPKDIESAAVDAYAKSEFYIQQSRASKSPEAWLLIRKIDGVGSSRLAEGFVNAPSGNDDIDIGQVTKDLLSAVMDLYHGCKFDRLKEAFLENGDTVTLSAAILAGIAGIFAKITFQCDVTNFQ